MITTNTRTKDPANDEIKTFDPIAAASEAYRILKKYGPMPAEQITFALKDAGHIPHDDRSFGGVYLRLSNAKKIIQTGETSRARGHGSAGNRIWSAVNSEEINHG